MRKIILFVDNPQRLSVLRFHGNRLEAATVDVAGVRAISPVLLTAKAFFPKSDEITLVLSRGLTENNLFLTWLARRVKRILSLIFVRATGSSL